MSVQQTNVWMLTYIPLRCGGDGVHYLYNAMQGRVCPDGHVSATEVIVNRTHHADDVQMGGTVGLICSIVVIEVRGCTCLPPLNCSHKPFQELRVNTPLDINPAGAQADFSL